MTATRHHALVDRFVRARKDKAMAVLEGFHALKHALRFGAAVELVVAADPAAIAQIAEDLAPDLHGRLGAVAVEQVPPELLSRLAPRVPHTQVLSLAARPPFDGDRLRRDRDTGAIVLLEDPRDLGNIGAVVRAAAGAGAGGVVTTGTHDPWDASAIRGSTGLHYALPVGRDESFTTDTGERPLLALDPDGELLDPARLPPDGVLAFGTERDGVSDALLARADARLRLPMRAGVSSLNLATAVAAVLFAWRLADLAPRDS
ncbi:MAG TPA: TrmH family RNA methyltransferase [Conexibacter sp.]|nr:TrmH family RNA methyltransferase [Conexibacter sp.]